MQITRKQAIRKLLGWVLELGKDYPLSLKKWAVKNCRNEFFAHSNGVLEMELRRVCGREVTVVN